MSAPGPAFQFYVDDFLGGTVGWSCAEVGAYVRLLMCQWVEGAIPQSSERCRRIAGAEQEEWLEIWATISRKFDEDGKNPKMEKIRVERLKYIERQRKAGQARARQRYNGENLATATATAIAAGVATDQVSLLPSPFSPLTSSVSLSEVAQSAPPTKKKVRKKRKEAVSALRTLNSPPPSNNRPKPITPASMSSRSFRSSRTMNLPPARPPGITACVTGFARPMKCGNAAMNWM